MTKCSRCLQSERIIDLLQEENKSIQKKLNEQIHINNYRILEIIRWKKKAADLRERIRFMKKDK